VSEPANPDAAAAAAATTTVTFGFCNKEQPLNCYYCKYLSTVEHILTSCSAYKNIKRKALLLLPAPTHLNQHF